MKRLLGFSLLVSATLLYANTPAVDPAKQLYDTGIQQTAEGKLADARATLKNLVDAYPTDPLALQAKGAIDATNLFEEGQSRVKAGKFETARVAFETLIAVYPENPLATKAKSEIQTIVEKEKVTKPVVKSMEFRDLPLVPADELRAEMDARELRLAVGKPCATKDLEQAREAIEEILNEKGIVHAHVEARTRPVPPHAVAIVFTVEKSHGSLLLSPWRLAMARWHRVHPASENSTD